MYLLQVQIMTQQQFATVDQLQHHEIADLRTTGLAIETDPLRKTVTPMGKHADDLLETRQQIMG
ncbi:hypothetical protein D3C84_1120540 [compost metagenome]